MKTKIARKGKNLALGLISLFVFSMMTASSLSSTVVATQEQQEQQGQPLQWPPQIGGIIQVDEDGYRIGVIGGWVWHKLNTTNPVVQHIEKDLGWAALFVQCPVYEVIPQIGGTYSLCIDATDNNVLLMRFADLELRPEFAEVLRQQPNYNITTSDLLALFLQFIEQIAADGDIALGDIKLRENIDLPPVNVTDPQTNQTIATAPAKYVELSEENPIVGGRVDTEAEPVVLPFFLVLDNTKTTTQTTTGYVLVTFNSDLGPELRQILNSFELLAAVNSTTTTSTTPAAAVEE